MYGVGWKFREIMTLKIDAREVSNQVDFHEELLCMLRRLEISGNSTFTIVYLLKNMDAGCGMWVFPSHMWV